MNIFQRFAPQGQDIAIEVAPHRDGRTAVEDVAARLSGEVAALVIPQPNFLGRIEDAPALAAAAREAGALVIAMVNPIAMALLAPPGESQRFRISASRRPERQGTGNPTPRPPSASEIRPQQLRHARACPGHPRLLRLRMAGARCG